MRPIQSLCLCLIIGTGLCANPSSPDRPVSGANNGSTAQQIKEGVTGRITNDEGNAVEGAPSLPRRSTRADLRSRKSPSSPTQTDAISGRSARAATSLRPSPKATSACRRKSLSPPGKSRRWTSSCPGSAAHTCRRDSVDSQASAGAHRNVGCYYVVCVDSSDVVNFLLNDIGTDSWKDDVKKPSSAVPFIAHGCRWSVLSVVCHFRVPVPELPHYAEPSRGCHARTHRDAGVEQGAI